MSRVHSSNHYQIINGRLSLPLKQTDPQYKQKNYKYIPYRPINKPIESQEYFKATIDELIHQNKSLKNIIYEYQAAMDGHDNVKYIQDKFYLHYCGNEYKEKVRKGESTDQQFYAEEIELIRAQFQELKSQYCLLETQLKQQRALATMREQQCTKLRGQNLKLHNTINELVNQLDTLKNKLNHSEMQSSRINSTLQKYEETMKRIAFADKLVTQNTQFSQILSRNLEQSRKSQAKVEEKECFYSIKAHSNYEDDQRFMTPRVNKDQGLNDLYKNRSVEQKLSVSRVSNGSQKKYNNTKIENSKKYSENNSNYSGNNSRCLDEWATPNSKFSTIDLLDECNDPIAGSLSFGGLFSSAKK